MATAAGLAGSTRGLVVLDRRRRTACPATLIVPVGGTFTCELDGLTGATETITLTVDNWLGDISWLDVSTPQ